MGSGFPYCRYFFGTDFTDYAVLCWGRAEDGFQRTDGGWRRTHHRDTEDTEKNFLTEKEVAV